MRGAPPQTHVSVTTGRHITDDVHNTSRAPSEASAAKLARRGTLPKTHASITARRLIAYEVYNTGTASREASAARLARRPTKHTQTHQ